MLDNSFLGRVYPASDPYVIDRAMVAAFARAIGADDPLHFDPQVAQAAGYADVVAPPTFPIRITLQAGHQIIHDPALGLDYSRVVHADQRFVYARPVVAGDELRCVGTIEELMSRAGSDFVTLRTEVFDAADQLVLQAWTRLVARGQ